VDRLRGAQSGGRVVSRSSSAQVAGEIDEDGRGRCVGGLLEASTVTARIALASVDTARGDRDEHVRSADILDVANRPELVFRSTSFTPAGPSDSGEWTLAGEVTIGERSGPVTLAVEFGGLADFPGGPRHAGFSATGELHRSDFGIAPEIPTAFLGDVVRIDLEIQLLEPPTGAE
jgi:polyisoprenoid-binding protein YceI